MRLLVVADTTENWVADIEKYAIEADLVLSLGDMYVGDVKRLTGHGTPVAGVYGNHCRPGYLKEIGATDLSHGGIASTTRVRGGGVSFGVLGVSGCVRYSNAAYLQWSQEEYARVIDSAPNADWVVTHCPPRGCNDGNDPAHYGIDALTRYVERNHPSHIFHGHTYPEVLRTNFLGARVHYVHGWSVIEV